MEGLNTGTFQVYIERLISEDSFQEIRHPELRPAGQSSCLLHTIAPTTGGGGTGNTDAPTTARGGTDNTDPRLSRLELAAFKRNSCLKCAQVIYNDFVKQEAATALAWEAGAAAREAAAAAAARDAPESSTAATRRGLEEAGGHVNRVAPGVIGAGSPASYKSGDTSLHYVARSGNLSLLCSLIALAAKDNGHEGVIAFVGKPNALGETVLHETIMLGNKDMVELLLWVDPKLAAKLTGDGTSPLYLAVTLGHEDIVRMMTTTQLNDNIRCYGPLDQNVLHAAVFHGRAMTELILDWSRGRDLIAETDDNGSTPLHFIVSELVQHFRVWGVRLWVKWWVPELPPRTMSKLSHPSAAYTKDKQGLYPVHVAAKMGRKDAIDIMLKKCPDCVFLRDDGFGRTFLHFAVQYKSKSVVRYACATSAAASILNARDITGDTALHQAVAFGNLPIFYALMLKKEVSLNLRNKRNQTPLDIARSMMSRRWMPENQNPENQNPESQNPENLIYRILENAGGKNSSARWDLFINMSRPKPAEFRERSYVEFKDEDEEIRAPKLTDSARSLGICSALIASVTFSVTFAILSGLKSADGNKAGTPPIFGTWYFNAFMMSNTLAFIYSLTATVNVMYSGMSVFTTEMRHRHVQASAYLVTLSLTCLTAAFALGLYTVRAPLGHWATVVFSSFVLIAAVPLTRGMKFENFAIATRILIARRGYKFAFGLLLWDFIGRALVDFWPVIPIAGWAVCSIHLVKAQA